MKNCYVEGTNMKYIIFEDGSLWSVTSKSYMKTWERNGYRRITLRIDGAKVNKSIHVLVAEAFLPKEKGLTIVNHLDGDKLNNHVSNLEWTTHSGNMLHAHRTGLISKERRKPNHLTKEDVAKIVSLKGIKSQEELSLEFGVSRSTIWRKHKNL